MKHLAFSAFIMFANVASAQTSALPVDERGVHTFLEITKSSTPKEQLPANVKAFFKSNSKQVKLRSSKGDTAFFGTGKLVLFKSTGGIGHPTAEVNFNVSVELKNDKYRLILTDYIITPYERDRYANFVPTTIKYRLEDKPGKLNKGEWENNMKSVVTESSRLSAKLKSAMNANSANIVADEKKPAAVSTTKW
jgi:hypothetical protein